MTPTDTVVSEARRVLTECLDAFDDEVAEALMGGSERADSWPDIDVPVEALRTLLAIDRRTATPQSGGVRLTAYEMQVLIGTSMSGCVMQPDTTFNVQNAWKRLHDLGLIDRADGLAIATTSGRDRIRSALADPIPEAPADEEVASAIAAEVMGNDHLRHLLDEQQCEEVHGDVQEIVLRALRRSTKTDKPGVREAALEEAAKVADMFAADHAKSADQFGIDRNRELHNAAKGAAQGVAFAIRAISASTLTEEQPVAGHQMSTAPIDGTPILVWWPIVAIDEETGTLSDRELGGAWLVTEMNGGSWLEPDVLNAFNSVAFDDDHEYAEAPRLWRPLPSPAPLPRSTTGGAK